MAASKDKARAILSYATPNPVGPYRLVTPPTPDLGAGKTKTPVMPVMGGPLVNLPAPVMPTKQVTPVAPPLPGRLVNVPTQQGRVVDKTYADVTLDPRDFMKTYKVGHPYTQKSWGGATNWDNLQDQEAFWEPPDVSRVGAIDSGDMNSLTDDIEKRGITEPVIVDWKTKEVLNGHHRVIAASTVGAKIPVIFVNKPSEKGKKSGRK